MTSYDVLISRLDAQDAKISDLSQTVAVIAQDVQKISFMQEKLQEQISMLQNFIAWGFAILAVVVAFVSLFVPMVTSRKESSPNINFYGAIPAGANEKKEEAKIS